jgi:hypothetical protein
MCWQLLELETISPACTLPLSHFFGDLFAFDLNLTPISSCVFFCAARCASTSFSQP